MSTEEVVRGYLDAVNSRDWSGIRQVLHPEYSYMGGDGEIRHGPDAGIAVAEMFIGAISDARINVERIHVDGDTAIVEFIGTGTHDGEFQGIPASGRKLKMPVCNVLVVRDGKIYAEREYMDMAHFMRQIGALPASVTA
jgi:steroid delta-isomerase-like uncharacterized protein